MASATIDSMHIKLQLLRLSSQPLLVPVGLLGALTTLNFCCFASDCMSTMHAVLWRSSLEAEQHKGLVFMALSKPTCTTIGLHGDFVENATTAQKGGFTAAFALCLLW